MPETTGTALRQQASALCRQLHEAPADRRLVARIDAWRQQSPAHEACWQQTQQQWQLSGHVERHEPARLLPRLWYSCDLAWERLRENPAARAAMVAVPLVLLTIAVLLPALRPQPAAMPVPPPLAQQTPALSAVNYSSSWGEQRTHTLADGSIITLNWNSIVTVTLTPDSRHVALQRGEALFTVAPDKSRPFIVSVGEVQARAVGTAFSVRRDTHETAHIVVTEGTVEVAVPALSPLLLNANQAVSADPLHLGSIAAIDGATAIAWTEGMLVFRERPLLEVLNELGRYTNFKIMPGSVRNAGSPVTATYFTERADDALTLVAQAFDLQLVRNADGSVRVNSLPPQRTP